MFSILIEFKKYITTTSHQFPFSFRLTRRALEVNNNAAPHAIDILRRHHWRMGLSLLPLLPRKRNVPLAHETARQLVNRGFMGAFPQLFIYFTLLLPRNPVLLRIITHHTFVVERYKRLAVSPDHIAIF